MTEGFNFISGKPRLCRAAIIETTWICSIILAFPLRESPPKCGIKDVTSLLSSVGSSSPPSWLRPFRVLSNGEQFRVTIARVLAEQPELLVFDEFTSVVDRNVAKVASAAIAKAVRRRKQKFIAVSCHHDIIEWLQPDWIYEPAGDQLTLPRGSLQRPKIELEIFRVHYPAWELFRKHHYLDTNLNRSAICFVALWQNIPVAFSAWLPLRSGTVSNGYREHRTVTLPDFQGVGIGNALSACCASMWRGLGKRVFSATSHPSMISTRERSPLWRVTRSIQLGVRDSDSRMKHAMNRMTAGFEYIGEMMPPKQAQELLSA